VALYKYVIILSGIIIICLSVLSLNIPIYMPHELYILPVFAFITCDVCLVIFSVF